MNDETKIKLASQVMVISGIFCLMVAMLLILNFWHMKKSEPLESATMEAMVKILKDEPNNEQLKEEIRNFDLLARKAYFTSRWQVKTGAYLLLFGGILFAISLKTYTDLRAKIGLPENEEEQLIKSRYLTQRWILIGGVVVLTLALSAAWFSNDYLKEYVKGDIVLADNSAIDESIDQIEMIEIVDPNVQTEDPSDLSDSSEVAESSEEPDVSVDKTDPVKSSAQTYFGIEEFKKNQNLFRGLFGHGIAYHKNIPTDWDGSSGKNIKWKVAIPKPGNNSPVIWGDKLFVAGGDSQSRVVYCYNRNTGQLLWERAADNIPGSPATTPRVTDDTGLASPTMAVDGYKVYAIFATGDIIAFDLEGNRVWAINIGVPVNHYGHSSSLLVWKEKLVIQYDTGKGGRMLAVNTSDGETIWDVKRDNQISWASPILIQVEDKFQVVTSSDPYVAGHDLETGEELWRVDAMMGEVGPSPAYDDGLVYATNEYARLVAVKPEPGAEYTWENDEYLSEAASPVALDGLIYLATSYGVVVCYDGKTGEYYWEKEYAEGFYSSPMIAEGKLYVIDMGGVMHILKADKTGTEIGSPELGEAAFATPVFAEGVIYLRGEHNLYCIAE